MILPELVMPCRFGRLRQQQAGIAKVRAGGQLLPHHGLLEGEECQRFLAAADFWLVETRRRLQAAHNQGKSEEEMLQLLKQQFYTDQAQRCQPEQAFDLNAHYTIAQMLKKDA